MSTEPFEGRLASLEGAYRQVSDRLNSIDHRLDGFEQRVDARFQTLESKIDGLRSENDSKFAALGWRMTTLTLGSWITLMIAILLHH